MNGFLAWIITIISLIFILWKLEPKHHVLVVGVLSSREHHTQRNIIRAGIRKQLNQENEFPIALKFIVSQHPCHVPVEHRVDIYGCQPIIYSRESKIFYLNDNNLKPLGQIHQSTGPVGIDFMVQQDIVINELGIFDSGMDGIKGNVKIVIYNRINQEPVVAVVILSFSQGNLKGNYLFKPVSNSTLPKGFKGSLVVEGTTENDQMLYSEDCNHDNGAGLIKIAKGLRFGQQSGEFPVSFLKDNTQGCLVGPTMSFSTSVKLKENRHDYSNHRKKLLKEQSLIDLEVQKYNDLVLVNTVECYRNLPEKMLEFYVWLSKRSFDYFLKSDDDCYLNVTGIFNSLGKFSTFDNSNLWIGSFREFFPIQNHGKWAEIDYQAVSYPPFACGSGYILSYDIVQWLSSNRKRLKTYQGEDTSLGIWLAAINPDRIRDFRFQCARTCPSEIFSLPENSLSQLRHLYETENISC